MNQSPAQNEPKENSTIQQNSKAEQEISLSELLGPKLSRNLALGDQIRTDYQEAMIEPKIRVIGLFFADYASSVSRGFVPTLKHTYETWKWKGYPMEVVYIPNIENVDDSLDSAEKHGDWLTLTFDEKHYEILKEHFGINSTPSLIFVNKHSEILCTKGIITVTMEDASETAEKLMEKYHEIRIAKNRRESDVEFVNEVNHSSQEVADTEIRRDSILSVHSNQPMLAETAIATRQKYEDPLPRASGCLSFLAMFRKRTRIRNRKPDAQHALETAMRADSMRKKKSGYECEELDVGDHLPAEMIR